MRCNTYNLEELVNIKYGKNQKKIFSKTGTVPIYGTGGLIGYGTQYLYNKPSILIGRKGSIEKIRYVEHPFWTVDTLFYTEINTNLVIPLYLYYKILLIDLSKYNEGTTIPSLRTETLNKLQFEIPNIEDQLKIVSIIRPIDLKIENNQQINHNLWLYIILYVCDKDAGTILFIYVFIDYEEINHNLEEQAKAIYKSWFIDFDPFGGVMPKNWYMGTIADIIDLHDAKRIPLSSKQRNTMQKKYPYYGATGCLDYVDNYIFDGIYLLLGEDGTVVDSKGFPILQYVHGKFWVNNHAHIITGKSNFSVEFLYLLFSITNIASIVTGAVQQKISQQSIKKLPTIIPNSKILIKFNNIVQPIFAQIRIAQDSISALTALRDTLLPKLMSGEIDVSAVEIGR